MKKGYTLACGYSFEHGTAEIRQASKWIDEALFQVVSPFSHKLIFMLIPRFIRKWIPLRYWPEMCEELGPFWDNLLECVDNHAKQFNVDDQPVCLLDAMQRDYQKGLFTYSDMFHTVQSLLIGSADTVSECKLKQLKPSYSESAFYNFSPSAGDVILVSR